MSPPNLSAVARQHGISRNTLGRWRDTGLDITDEKAVAARVAIMRKPSSAETAAPSPGSESYAEAKRRRATADANLAEMKAAQQMGKLIDLATVEQTFAEIGYLLRARLLALPSNLVAELEGLTPAQIHLTLKKHIHQLLHDLHENSPIKKPTASSTNSTSSTSSDTTKDTSRG